MKLNATAYHTEDGNPAKPNAIQEWTLSAAFSQAIDELFVFGGFGSGKTQLLAWYMRDALVMARAFWNGKRTGKMRAALCSSTGAQLRTVTFPAFAAALNALVGHDGPFWHPSAGKRNPLVKGFSRDDALFELPWCTVTLASGHNGCLSTEGGKYTVIGADESVLWLPEGIDRVRARFRQVGYPFRCLAHFATPQPGRSLLKIKQRFEGLAPYSIGTETDGSGTYGRCRIMMPTRLNLANLPAGYLAQLAADCSPAMYAAITEGELIEMGSLVYGGLYGPENVIPHAFDPSAPVLGCWDTAYRRPYFGVLQACDGHDKTDDDWCVFDEVVKSNVSTGALFREIAQASWYPSLSTIYHDPAARAVEETTGRSPVAEARRVLTEETGRCPAFVTLPPDPEYRIKSVQQETVRRLLRAYNGVRRLYVSESIAGRQYGTGSDGRPVVGIDLALKRQPLKPGTDEADRGAAHDHLSHPVDALEYLCQCRWPTAKIDRSGWMAATEKQAAGSGMRPADLGDL